MTSKDNLPIERLVKTQKQVAEHFHVRPETVKDWRKKGMPVEDNGLYDLGKIASWRVQTGQRRKLLGINLDVYKRDRADILASRQAKANRIVDIIDKFHFSEHEISRMDKREAVQARETLRKDEKDKFEMERLERGQSTDNVAVLVMAIKEAKKRLRGGNGKRVEENKAQDQGNIGDSPRLVRQKRRSREETETEDGWEGKDEAGAGVLAGGD